MADLTELNRAHFDNSAATYNSRRHNASDQVLGEFRNRRKWVGVDWIEDESDEDDDDQNDANAKEDGKKLRLLDYACGTGLVSKAFAPYVSSSIGIDLSANMVNEYNRSANDQGIPSEEMFAVQGNLLDPASSERLSGPEFFDFDIAVISLSLHHIHEPEKITQKVIERVKPGGTLLVLDFAPHGAHPHGEESKQSAHGQEDESLKTIAHHGFSEEEIKKVFEFAGAATEFEYLLLERTVSHPRHKHGHGHDHGHDHGEHHHHGHAGPEGDKAEMRRIFMAKGKKL